MAKLFRLSWNLENLFLFNETGYRVTGREEVRNEGVREKDNRWIWTFSMEGWHQSSLWSLDSISAQWIRYLWSETGKWCAQIKVSQPQFFHVVFLLLWLVWVSDEHKVLDGHCRALNEGRGKGAARREGPYRSFCPWCRLLPSFCTFRLNPKTYKMGVHGDGFCVCI